MLPNKYHPDTGKKWWILRNMSRNHRKTYFKVSTRVINHSQGEPRPTEATSIGSSCWNFNIYSNQGRIQHKWNTPPAIWPNWKNIFRPYWKISSEIRQRGKIYTGDLPLWCKKHPNHTTKKNNRTLNIEWDNKNSWKVEKAGINTKYIHYI